MIFIDPSFFTGELHIPNLENSDVKDYEFFKLATALLAAALLFSPNIF